MTLKLIKYIGSDGLETFIANGSSTTNKARAPQQAAAVHAAQLPNTPTQTAAAAPQQDIPPAPPNQTPETNPATQYRAGIGGGDAGLPDPLPKIRLKDITVAKMRPYLIKGLIDLGCLIVIYGASGSGKSFIAINWSLHISAGRDWRGMRARQAIVIYVAAEGATGIQNRLYAAREQLGLLGCDLPFVLVPAAVNLLNGDVDIDRVVYAIGEERAIYGDLPVIVVLDTLSRVMAGGDENGPKDMTTAVDACGAIQSRTGATVMLIHHAGKDAAKGARGHSSLKAATDTEIEVARSTEDPEKRWAANSKLKEGPDGTKFPFALQSKYLGDDEEGDPIGTAIVEWQEVEISDEKPKANKLSGAKQRTMIALHDALAESGHAMHDARNYPVGVKVVKRDHFFRFAEKHEVSTSEDKANRKRTISRTIEQLMKEKIICCYNGFFWVAPN